ncbi:MAG TPA: tRNA uracil 4-sulfurtransferase ThiI [Methylomirabilota bacterium]|nr:tRNA uracil 4-sulfurtransferase ThiI [Methylomirabilota bacterium]
MRTCVLVHYHEIALKGGNRPLFLRQLEKNLSRAVSNVESVSVVRLSGRMIIDCRDQEQAAEVCQRLQHVFGIANFAAAFRVSPTLEAFKHAIELWLKIRGDGFDSFRIAARRAYKSFPLTSMELNEELGRFVQDRTGSRVDLKHPALTIHVEALPSEGFVYLDRVPGPGGLPVGVSGRVVSLLSGGIDSPVAAWRAMKRGCRVTFVHFHSAPYLPATSQAKAKALVELLTRWQYASRLYLVPFGEIQREVVLTVPPPYRVVVYRRLMARIAEGISRANGAEALVTGESLGQVASQTLGNLTRIDEVTGLLILRPLIGMDKQEIIRQAQAIGSYEISIEPDQDCCTLFVPRHPSTSVRPGEISALESRLDLDKLVRAGVESASVFDFSFPPRATETEDPFQAERSQIYP